MKIWRREDSEEVHKSASLHQDLTGYGARSETDYPPQIELYTQAELLKCQSVAKLSRDEAEVSFNQKLLQSLARHGQMRELRTMRPTFRGDLECLRRKFPNFGEVIDYVRRCAEVAWRTDKVLRFTPILLNGPGGVGKSFFSEALANWMNHGFHRISVSSSQDGSQLAGSSSFFSNSKPGVPFNALVNSDHANHVIFLDEIDKNSTRTYDALGALYVLLEPSTARHYKDQSANLVLDASHLLWIAASNEADNLAPALRTRFVEFQVSITPDQSRVIAESIVSDTLRSLAPATNGMTFSPSAIETLSQMTPRKIRQVALDAIGDAFVHEITLIDTVKMVQPPVRRIGFLS